MNAVRKPAAGATLEERMEYGAIFTLGSRT